MTAKTAKTTKSVSYFDAEAQESAAYEGRIVFDGGHVDAPPTPRGPTWSSLSASQQDWLQRHESVVARMMATDDTIWMVTIPNAFPTS